MCVGTPPESNAPRTHSTQRIEPSRALMTTFSLGSTTRARATALASFSTVAHVIVFSEHSLRLHGAISLVDTVVRDKQCCDRESDENKPEGNLLGVLFDSVPKCREHLCQKVSTGMGVC